MKRTIRVALCGAIAAIEVLLLLLTNLIPSVTLALPAVAGVLLMVIVMEVGVQWSWAVFAVSSVLSFFLMSDRKAFLLYVLFLGYYPTLKATIENHVHSRGLGWVLKLLLLNFAVILDFVLVIFVLNLPLSMTFSTPVFPFILLLGANAAFVVYDVLLSGLVVQYWSRLHPHISKIVAGRK